MGITIHYNGRIQDMARLPELSAKLKHACQALNWPYVEINERVVGFVERLYTEQDPEDEHTSYVRTETEPLDDRWQGLAIHPPECEALLITFNRAGNMLAYHAHFDSPPGTYWLQESMFCKTQFSSVDVHIEVCNLLRLVQPYMAEWEVFDEGNYWESGDRAELEGQLGHMAALIDHMSSELGHEALEDVLGRKVGGKIEVGKEIAEKPPVWRQHWGDSAHEN